MKRSSDGLRIALAQLNYKVGDIDGNVLAIRRAMNRARSEEADLVVFSEMAVLGYPPRDMVHRSTILEKQYRGLEEIASQTDEDLAAIVGFVDMNGKDQGHQLVNGAAFCHGGEVVSRVAKKLLPTYDVFDELRYFAPAPSESVVNFRGVKLGISICEDAWGRVESAEMPTYSTDPIDKLVEAGAEVLINIAASPFSLDKGEFRRQLLAEHCRRHEVPLFFVNQVGGNDELIFDGRSLVVDAGGEPRVRLAEFEEDFQVVDVDSKGALRAREDTPMRPVAKTRAEQARGAIVVGIRDYVEKTHHSAVILGLSGGIDSSVSAALVAEALGPENVHGVAMPSRYSSSHSREDARELATRLGIKFDEIPIEGPYRGMLDALEPHFEDRPFDATEENLQARIRGVYLMALSNKFGSLVVACGNKSELAVGYTTLYGDMCGALAVIGDLPKMLVYEVARLYNEDGDKAVIPKRVLDKAPSAELRPDQKDQDSLPDYAMLDDILEKYIVHHRTIDEIVDDGFDDDIVREVVGMVHRNEYKRWQAPPVLKVTTKAFGVGWRYPLAASYRR